MRQLNVDISTISEPAQEAVYTHTPPCQMYTACMDYMIRDVPYRMMGVCVQAFKASFKDGVSAAESVR